MLHSASVAFSGTVPTVPASQGRFGRFAARPNRPPQNGKPTASARSGDHGAAAPVQKSHRPAPPSTASVEPARSRRPIIAGGPWTEPTYADSTAGDFVDGEDLTIRRAAVDALGPYNGSVVVVDPQTGRILTMVNQKVALGSGFQPCSTIKVSVALAGLSEKVIEPQPKLPAGRHEDGPDLRAGALQQLLLRDAWARSSGSRRSAITRTCSGTARRPG